ncbi:D-aminopeptidase [Acidisoma cellulosilytica]|uniref:D-aminopeptidase n=1 Tax=Acidisoma cellulosilyticum TaxID=2802395 RepID=A0A963Z1J1_9PROT|nr:D-aminopeptidase [Acidisoma cellulosilyticum]MCB8880956.1 D-aminopeptidase [Acidisoma cellulosilyticum]
MSASALDRALAGLPQRYAGPGGAVAVLKDGAVLARHAWGWADAERRIPFTPQTISLICSISKQFTCAVLLDQFPDPTVMDSDLHRRLPLLEGERPGILDLAHNQSGLRDYWAVAMLYGAPVEGLFTGQDAERIISRTRSLHFSPGTRYSYVNQNFRLLSDIIEARTGEDFASLLRRRIFDRAGMPYALLNADTSWVAGGTVGYEGSVAEGFRPAVNRIQWTGDAGIGASLDDMIAWETHIDATRDDPAALYSRLAAPVTFRDGAPASYGFGLARTQFLGRDATCHGGALRGFRSFRAHVPSERISVVTLFNHMGDPRGPVVDILAALLGETADAPAISADTQRFVGTYLEPETGIATRIAAAGDGRLRLDFGHGAEMLSPVSADEFASASVRLTRADGALRMARTGENLFTTLTPHDGAPATDIEGVFRSDELGAEITCIAAGGTLYGAFSGFLGQGAMQLLEPFGPDCWLLPCPRALDYSPPGDWTLRFTRDAAGRVDGVTLGCWLARRIPYRRVA